MLTIDKLKKQKQKWKKKMKMKIIHDLSKIANLNQ